MPAQSSPPIEGTVSIYERVPIRMLSLDAENPRLVEYGLGKNASQEQILEVLWQRMAVDEVAMSIAADGYWNHEPLFIAREKGKDVVVEGNRRLAAVMILLDKELRRRLRATDLPEISSEHREQIKNLPIVRIDKREDIWRYLGFKHVNGPAKWGSYAKAQYIAFVRKSTGESLNHIAEQIGDKHRTVQRLYRALMVIEQAERMGVWKRDFCYNDQLHFSHLTTALDYSGFQSFLKLTTKETESNNPVDSSHAKELGEVCRWLWGDSRNNTPPIIKSQNPDLRQLDEILSSAEAVATLRLGHGLEAAYEISRGDDIVFSEALQDAKNALMKAQGRVSSGYRNEKHLLDLAETISEMAYDLVATMTKKASGMRTRSLHRNREEKE